MTEERIFEMFEEADAFESKWVGDNALQGLNILAKYVPEDESVLCGAEHDKIYSVYISDVAEKITEEDVKALINLNWFLEDDYFTCFV